MIIVPFIESWTYVKGITPVLRNQKLLLFSTTKKLFRPSLQFVIFFVLVVRSSEQNICLLFHKKSHKLQKRYNISLLQLLGSIRVTGRLQTKRSPSLT